ncbi:MULTISPECIES: hypothetical protein [Oscillospiraceae]|uniref:Bacteriocin n=1 Tax=Harryflintia acetispora TaxID=1849041 RepID=A0A9X8Y8S5_9FIRM|nr:MULTISPECIES: hypothetical protein [Oscillospiraceae]TCL44413.1 hypothetical protein EDD78_10226 [Harryflintia acetispora]
MEKKTIGLFEEISSKKELDSINGGGSYVRGTIKSGHKFKSKPKKTSKVR